MKRVKKVIKTSLEKIKTINLKKKHYCLLLIGGGVAILYFQGPSIKLLFHSYRAIILNGISKEILESTPLKDKLKDQLKVDLESDIKNIILNVIENQKQ